MSTAAKIGLGFLGLIMAWFLIGPTAVVLIQAWTMPEMSPQEFDEARLGQERSDAQRRVRESDDDAAKAVEGREPSRPDGSECTYRFSVAPQPGDGRLVYRFCFQDGELVQKKQVRTASGDA
ncbi:hypothetical protein [Streptomyces sp. NPDC048639]|uniref:hypothetical protein n=1 Tax=Streptomyces sp. NPDC048639 TaxID=3365581 RepID=UPI003717DA4A